MEAMHERVSAAGQDPALIVALAGAAVLAIVAAFVAPWLGVLGLIVVLAVLVLAWRLAGGTGLQIQQIERLRQAELALAAADSTEEAAQELAEHAIALLGAPGATVIIEGIGDTVRVTRGDPRTSVYGDGSRMRLLDDAGVPCGSIAVCARADGRDYSPQQERMLDALAQRVSSTLHRLSLMSDVEAERRTIADVLESSSDGIFTVGLDLMVRSWNPAMARITGIPTDEAVGAPVGHVFAPVDEHGGRRHGADDPGRTGVAQTHLVRIEGAGGEERWLTCSWSPLSEGGYVVVARDDSERKKVQDDKDGWIAQVSHELRTPLTPIKGFLQTLQQRDDELSPQQRRRIYEVMAKEEHRLELLVSSLLQATTIDQHGLVVVAEALDWPAVVAEQVDAIRRADPSRDIEVQFAEGAAGVVADPVLSARVLANLLGNALKYTPTGSPIEVHVHRDGAAVVTVVRDHGPGIAPGDRERIFEKFTRLGDHLTRPQQGVGLGLYIARSSVEQMGGQIWCDAAPGGGTRFGFTLPASEVVPRAEAAAVTADGTDSR